MSAPRLAIVTTHPVQYYAPLFRELGTQGEVRPHVFYGWEGASKGRALDRGFGTTFAWDVPLLEGYDHTFVDNVSEDPGTHHFRGIDAPGLVPAVRSWRPDAVLVVGWNYRAHLQALRAFSGRLPVLFRGDSTLLDERGGPSGRTRAALRRVALRWVYGHVDHALYVGQHNRAYFRAHGLREEQLAWAPHAVDNARFAADADTREAEARAWRQTLGIAPGDRVALFVGKLERKKAPDLLLEAFLAGDTGFGHVVFCGTGPLEAVLRERAAGRSDVHFLGFQNQSRMPVAYRLGNALVLPSVGPGETWGLAVNEAMACGRPAVVSDRVGCAPDLVAPGAGRVVTAGSPTALVAGLRGVASPGAAERMSETARNVISAWTLHEAARRIARATVAATHS